MRFLKTLAMAAIGVVLSTAAGEAHAQVTAYAPGQGAVNSVAVAIDVRASVSGRCGFTAGGAPTGSISQTDFDRTGFSRDFAISMNCTVASRVAVSSRNGGLAAEVAASDGYAVTAPYTVALRMVADNGAAAEASCAAETLGAAGGCSFAGVASSTNGLRLAGAATKTNGSYLRVSAPAYTGTAPLVAGRYADTLSVTISVAP
jgi:hypothetical protein